MNIQFHGDEFTQSCLEAIARLIQGGAWIQSALLLTVSDARHAFLFELNEADFVFVKAGFTSGYHGEGPAGFATALQLLIEHGVTVEETVVSPRMLRRIGANEVVAADVAVLRSQKVVRPIRVYDYIHHGHSGRHGCTKDVFSLVPPYGVVDDGIMDLARLLLVDPDTALLKGYRRLEVRLAEICRLDGESANGLVHKAFMGKPPILVWPGVGDTEAGSRAQLFKDCFTAFRNRRAHKEIQQDPRQTLREFLLLNELFSLVSDAELNPEAEIFGGAGPQVG